MNDKGPLYVSGEVPADKVMLIQNKLTELITKKVCTIVVDDLWLWIRYVTALVARSRQCKIESDPEVRQRVSNWSVAIGMQDVDHLRVLQFLIDIAKRNIRGEITQKEVARLIEEYHSMGRRRKEHCDTSSTN